MKSQNTPDLTQNFTSSTYIRNNTNAYIKKKPDYLLNNLTNTKLKYYTYTDKTDKNFAYIIKGLDFVPTVDELDKELKDINFTFTKIYNMRTKNTDNNTTSNTLCLHGGHSHPA